jgi:excisionase family DNA binding protein
MGRTGTIRVTVAELQLLSTKDVQTILRCSRTHVDRLVGQGDLPRLKIGSMARFRPSDVERLIER